MSSRYTLADVIGDQRTASAVESMTMIATCIDREWLSNGIANCDMATSIGPIIDPTGCMNGGLSRAEATRRVLAAANRFVSEVRAAMGGAA